MMCLAGTNAAAFIAAVPFLLYGVGHLRKDSHARNTALLAGEAVADGFILAIPFKAIAGRKQPLEYQGKGPYSDSFFTGSHSPFHSGGFYSEHAMAATAVATIIAHRYRSHRWVPYVAYGLAGVISFSRITRGDHFASDAFLGGAKGTQFPVKEYSLMKRGQYQKLGNPLAMTPDIARVPLEMYEARNAMDIAKSQGADKDAPEIFSKAQGSLQMAENALTSKTDKKDIVSKARQTVQFAEDARALAALKQEDARIAAERDAAAAKAKAEAEAKAEEEAKRQAELVAAKQAQMKAEAEAAAVKAKAEADSLQAREEAARADAERSRRAAEALRAQLLAQFNRVLETRDTPRGLVVNMGDVLFDFGKYDLRPEAREKLARLSGIILGHPGLNLAVEGYTDNVGTDEINQTLSEKRAGMVRGYLIDQGLTDASVSAQGFGKSSPVADNATAPGRQVNRRVEIVVSGEIIGQKIGS
jgi:outer membrane protein OmpA-like peptidoglycan-associated protein